MNGSNPSLLFSFLFYFLVFQVNLHQVLQTKRFIWKLYLSFFVLFFRLRGGVSWALSTGYAAMGIAFIMFLAWVLGRDFPPGLLQKVAHLPWPLT